MKSIGLDLSINSTGICINNEGTTKYHIIASDTSLTKKRRQELLSTPCPDIDYHIYEKIKPETKIYSEKEAIKTNNIYSIIKELDIILDAEEPDIAIIEGISYGSAGSAALVDLSGLNFMVRMLLIRRNIPYIIASPTENKKIATGNGGADKETMIYAWEVCEPHMKVYNKYKIDDLADAYFLSCYGLKKGTR